MSDAFYVKGAEKILSALINLPSDSIYVALVSSAYTPDLANHEFYSDLGANVLGTPQLLGSKTISGGKFDAADATFAAVAAGATVKALVIYKDPGAPAAPVANAPTTANTGGTLAAATYYYKVTALNAAGESLGSNEGSVTTTGASSSNTITWAAVSGATSYRVYRGTAAGAESTYYAPGNVTTFTDTGAAGTAGSPPTGTKPLIAYIDTVTGFPMATNGGDITPQWDNGTYRIVSLV